jgi:hypothetical protein
MTPIAIDECPFFDAAEQALVRASMQLVAERHPEEGELLAANLTRLAHTALVIAHSPPISASLPARGARGSFSSESLVDVLCRVPDYDFDLHIPTKAVLGQAFLIAKINFFKALGYALEAVGAPHDDVDAELGQSIYSKLAEELFISIVSDPGGLPAVKRAAASSLFRIWEERLSVEIDDFAPFLESVWRARDRLRPVLGTMRGTHEMLRLLQDSRDGRVLEYFTEDVPAEQLEAFEEFLFGLSHEEIERLRAHLIEQSLAVVSADDACGILGRNKASWAPASGPHAFYSSYKQRRVRAAYRLLTHTPGPKKTAEEYMMAAFLLRERPEERPPSR